MPSDALAANTSVEKNVVRAYCLAHARRKVFELREDYPAESAVVLDAVSKVYGYEADAAGMNAERRLAYHQGCDDPRSPYCLSGALPLTVPGVTNVSAHLAIDWATCASCPV